MFFVSIEASVYTADIAIHNYLREGQLREAVHRHSTRVWRWRIIIIIFFFTELLSDCNEMITVY